MLTVSGIEHVVASVCSNAVVYVSTVAVKQLEGPSDADLPQRSSGVEQTSTELMKPSSPTPVTGIDHFRR